jgi:carboxymethylenebutenolidase
MRPMPGQWESLSVDSSEMRCYRTAPSGEGAFPGVLVCMHAPGVDGFIRDIADRLADSGFAAIAPDLFHRQTEPEENPLKRMAKLRDDEILRDLEAATRVLRGLAEVGAEQTGVIGFCMGGRLAYLQAAEDSTLRASVVFYGGNILVPWGEGPSPFDRTDRIGCPVLGLFGEEDGNPSPADVAKIDAEMTRLGKVHEFKSYPGAGHAFLNEGRPSFRPEAAADAWGRCLDWLRQHLPGSPT